MGPLPFSIPISIQNKLSSYKEYDSVEPFENRSYQEVSSKNDIFSISLGTPENSPKIAKKSFVTSSKESESSLKSPIPELTNLRGPWVLNVKWDDEYSPDRFFTLQKFFPNEIDRPKLTQILAFIEGEKQVWLAAMRQFPHALMKRKTPIEKSNTNRCFSVYIAKSQKGILGIYLNLGKTHLLGEGCFKQVFKVLNLNTLKLAALSKTDPICPLEARIMQMFPNSPCLLQAESIEVIGKKLYMLSPCCELGDLSKAHSFLTQTEFFQVAKDVLQAVHILHTSYIAHRDIKPENILLYRDAQGNIRAKLADFGLAESFAANHTIEHRRGTLQFTPLEMLGGNFPSLFLEKGDSFAVGSTLYMTLEKLEKPEIDSPAPFRDLYPFLFNHSFSLSHDNYTIALQNYKKKFSHPNSPIQKIFFRLIHPDRNKRLTIWQALKLLNK